MAAPVSASTAPAAGTAASGRWPARPRRTGCASVTAITTAAPASMTIGLLAARAAGAGHQWQCSAARSATPQAASASSAAGTRRLRRCSHASRAAASSRPRAGAAAGGGDAAAVTASCPARSAGRRRAPVRVTRDLRQGDSAGPQRGEVRGQPGVPWRRAVHANLAAAADLAGCGRALLHVWVHAGYGRADRPAARSRPPAGPGSGPRSCWRAGPGTNGLMEPPDTACTKSCWKPS